MPTSANPQSLTVASAHQLLVDLVRSGLPPRTITAEASGGGWSVSVVICAAPTAAREAVTRCQRDILLVLSPGDRITTPGVLGELERRGILHGERTVRGALADLVRSGLVLSSRAAPRGYYLPTPAAEQRPA